MQGLGWGSYVNAPVPCTFVTSPVGLPELGREKQQRIEPTWLGFHFGTIVFPRICSGKSKVIICVLHKLATVVSFNGGVSNVSPSSERMTKG